VLDALIGPVNDLAAFEDYFFEFATEMLVFRVE
jgi:hypothetical protein